MQRTGITRRLIIFSIIAIAIAITVDMITKHFAQSNLEGGRLDVISGFFYFTYVKNTGSAFSFLADKSWAQTFFKILTGVSLGGFIALWIFAVKRHHKVLTIALSLIIAGAIGNFIDRLVFNYVRDFIGFTFFGWNFPVFNIADACLTVGVIMFIVHFLFLDKDALFKKKKKDEAKISSDEE